MQQVKNLSILPFCFFLLGGLCSCERLPPSSLNAMRLGVGTDITNIRNINKPQLDKEAIIYLQGKVVKQVPLIEWWVYQLQDSTGMIWVLTNQANVQQGDQLLIKGKVRYQSIPLKGQELGEVYIEEQQQLERISTR